MSHSDAKMFRDTIRDIVRDEMARLSPAERYAQVVQFVPGVRRVVVRYNGEPEGNEVTLPYNTAAPSYVGQWVRVGGPASDRHVVDLLGASEPERRLEEMFREAYLPQKWQMMDLRLLPTYPMAMFPQSGETFVLASRLLFGTMIRVPWDMSISQMMCYVAEGSGSGQIELSLYSVDEAFNMALLRTASAARSSGSAEYRINFPGGRQDLNRGEMVVATVWNNSSQQIQVPGVVTRGERTYRGDDFLSFVVPNLTSLPGSIPRASIPGADIRNSAMIHLSLLDVRGEG